MQSRRKLSIFVHRASEYLTDHASHGEGLICYSLLDGLAKRGHRIFAFTDVSDISSCHPNLIVKEQRHRVPANSLCHWELSWRAESWLRKLADTESIDLVWRMNPTGATCPYPPRIGRRPLAIGPIYYSWPVPQSRSAGAQPRFGIGIKSLVDPIAEAGWKRTLKSASLVFCATIPHAEEIRRSGLNSNAQQLPLIVNAPENLIFVRSRASGDLLRLIFVGHLSPMKNPQIFCDTIRLLRGRGIDATGTMIGDGPERLALEQYCAGVDDLGSAITFAGRVPNTEVYDRVASAELLLSTSLGEPYGRNIAEAMSVGTPAVCHRSGGPADFIEHGVNGLLVDQLDAHAYADAISPLVTDSDYWKRLSAGAFYTASHWTSGCVLDRLEDSLIGLADTTRFSSVHR